MRKLTKEEVLKELEYILSDDYTGNIGDCWEYIEFAYNYLKEN